MMNSTGIYRYDSCYYKGCQNSRKSAPDISFYKFPVKDTDRCRRWLINSGNSRLLHIFRDRGNFEPLKRKMICEKHFWSVSFRDPNAPRKILVPDAVPRTFKRTAELGGKVKCLFCRQILSVKNKSTSTLIRHLSQKHKKQLTIKRTTEAPIQKIVLETPQKPLETVPPSTSTIETSDCRPPTPSDADSMPLDQRLALPQGLQTKEDFASSGLQTQPASPPKLKVTRISTAAAAAPSPPKLEPAQPTTNDEVCLRWNSHHSNMQSTFPNLLQREQYVDVTLAAEGKTLKCHRLILSSCSPYFEEILNTISPFQHPVIFMKDVPFWVLKSLCDFMYAGEVNIQQNNLEELLRIAEMLKIKGLTGKEVVDEEKQKVVEQPKVIRVVKPTPPKVLQTTKTLKPIKMLKTQAEKPSEPLKKPDVYDPLDLLEPLYEEKADLEPVPGTSKEKQSPLKKQTGKKPKKRKHTSPEPESPAPSVFQTRKGTRSRPNIKVPKFFDTNYTKEQEKKSEETSLTDPAVPSLVDPLYEIEEIKAEPIDFEDNLLEFRDDEGFMDTTNEESIIGSYDSPLVNTLNTPIPAESNHTLPEINMVVPPDIPQDVPELVPIKSVEERSSVEKTVTPSKEDLNEIKTDIKKTEDLCPPLVSLVQKQSKKIDILESSEVVQSTDKSHPDEVTDTGETETPNSATDFEAPEEIGTGFNELSVEPLEEMGLGNNAMNESPGETGTQSNKTNIEPPGEIRTENN